MSEIRQNPITKDWTIIASQTWVIPKDHQPSFGQIDDLQLKDVAGTLNQISGRLYQKLHDPDYNLTLNTPPVREARQECCHWHIQILPRMGIYSGVELGSGIYIAMIYPEEAALFLREGMGGGENLCSFRKKDAD
jgi:UDPglucose--hexose-1-phosphate uridylyltransferase